jgi:NACHT domain
MDPLSAAANVIAVIEICSVVLSRCYRYAVKVKNASKEISQVINEVGSLKSILEDLKSLTQSMTEFNNTKLYTFMQTLDSPSGPLKMCELALHEVNAKLGSATVEPSLGNMMLWPWTENSIKKLLRVIQDQKSNIILAFTAEQTVTIRSVQTGLLELRLSLEQEKILTWIRSTDPSTNHNMACDKHEPLTGNWLLQSAEFRKWVKEERHFLWLHGIPGCGKTVLLSTVVEHVKSICHQKSEAIYAYYYFDFSDSRKQDYVNGLRSIIAQLAVRDTQMLMELAKLYKYHDHGKQEPDRRSIVSTLYAMLKSPYRIYIMFDALDECEDRDGLMRMIDDLNKKCPNNVSILATSRKERDIESVLARIVTDNIGIQSAVVDKDIRIHVKTCLNKDFKLQRWRNEVKQEIENKLVSGADGM